MNKTKIIEELSKIMATDEDLSALKSLIDERKNHYFYRSLDRELLENAKKEGDAQ